jgi:predicted SAM-dependent methyltransferase
MTGESVKKFLNVGGNNKTIPVPACFGGWDHLLLDIDPTVDPDILSDARELGALTPACFDAIYCSHNLEHYYIHDVERVLSGFAHVLKPEGFVYIRVPDILGLMKKVVAEGLDIDDILYTIAAGDIRVHDVLYGWGKQMEKSGNDFFAHKMGFSQKSLSKYLKSAGFGHRFMIQGSLEVQAIAFMQPPPAGSLELLGLGSVARKKN